MPLARRYAHPEVERRFLLAGVPPGLTGGRLVVDRYLPGTRLRLREVREPGSAVTRKLGQRIREGSGPGRIWHTSLELDEAEWELLCGLGGQVLVKARHTVRLAGGRTISVDVLGGRHTGLVLAEVDLAGVSGSRPAETDLAGTLQVAGLPVVREVTAEEEYTGARSPRVPGPGPGTSSCTSAPAAGSATACATRSPGSADGCTGSTSGRTSRPPPSSGR